MSWQPTASMETIKMRAQMNAYVRDFFALRQVMEVETPLLSQATVSDANLHSVSATCCAKPVYLHTSPEYPMKRMLCAGFGDIYQICKTFRDEEKGHRHNPEFTMLEYYRMGFDLKTLMDEVALLVGDFLMIQSRVDISYQQAVTRYAGFDPFDIDGAELRARVTEFVGVDLELTRDECLDIIMSHVVEPHLPTNTMVFVSGYPASQAALANVVTSSSGYDVAQRFELYINGLELANGYHELTDAQEQKKRFTAEQEKMSALDKGAAEPKPQDQYFLQALESGLPDCSGVALGLDRILMLKLDESKISNVVSFDFDRA